MNTQVVAGLIFPVARAGNDQALLAGVTTATLNGSGSYDLDGTITTYLWTQVSGPAAGITSPSTVSTGITGLTDSNTYVFRLTVTDNDTQQHSDDITVSVDVFIPSLLQIDGTEPSVIGTGTMSFTGGAPFEVLSLKFELFNTQPGDSLDFSGTQVGVLDDAHPLRVGSITLDSAGNKTVNYDGDGTPIYQCVVKITLRTPFSPLPPNKTILLNFAFTA